MALQDPQLPDTRPPTFAKGQAFGGVPHTRVFLRGAPTSGVWGWLEDGGIIAIADRIGDDTNFGFVQWSGEGDIEGDRWELAYGWQVIDADTYDVLFFATAARLDEPESARYENQFTPANLVLPINMPLVFEEGSSGAPPELVKFEIPEWAEPLERWPDAWLLPDQP